MQANFSRASSAVSKAKSSGVARFLPNPEENWGPKPRAGRNVAALKHERSDAKDDKAVLETDAKKQKIQD